MRAHYYWEGVSRQGKKISGNEKISRKKLQEKLEEQGVTILKIRFQLKNSKPKIKRKDVETFTLEFFTLLNSGISIQQALKVLVNTSDEKALIWIASTISNKISQGISLSEAFKAMPDYFNSVYCNMIYVGEQSGNLLEILQELIHMQKQLSDIRTKFWRAISYPTFIFVSTILITSGLLIFVMPKFQEIFLQSKIALPTLTANLIQFSEYLRTYWPLILGCIFGFPFSCYFLWKKNLKIGIRIEKILLRLPWVSDFIQRNQSARFARILASSLRAGLPLTKALEISAPTSSLRIYQKGTLNTLAHIKNGESFHSALKKAGFLKKPIQALIGIGESAGRLDEMLSNIAAMEQQALQNTIDVLSKWLEPVMMIMLGFIVGGMIIAMYLPLFQMNSGI